MQLKILRFDELKSTNLFLYDKMSEKYDISDEVVVTSYQTEGRGMDKNKWQSEAGKNLLFSIALNVNFLEAENQFKISQAVSVAIVETLEKMLGGTRFSIKWPNDIYFGDKKLAGILIQNTVEGMMMGFSIIGIGLNVNQILFGDELPNPVSLKMITGKEYDLDNVLNLLIINIKNAIENLRSDDGKAVIDRKYIKRLYRYREWSTYKYQNQVKQLIIIGFDKYGRLLLQDREGDEIVCDVKELQFVLP